MILGCVEIPKSEYDAVNKYSERVIMIEVKSTWPIHLNEQQTYYAQHIR
jgi:hypothetical protein